MKLASWAFVESVAGVIEGMLIALVALVTVAAFVGAFALIFWAVWTLLREAA